MEYIWAMFHLRYPVKKPINSSVFSEIAWLSFPGPDHRGLTLMLAAYFDDSGTHNQSSVVCWGGFIATCEDWDKFDKAWRAKLAAPLPGRPRLNKFGLGDCERHRNEFEGYSTAESDLLQNEFRQIIVDAKLLGVAFAVDRCAWDRVVTGEARERLGDAETVCFSSCFNAAIQRAVDYWPDELMLSLHFDRGRKSPKLDAIVNHVTERYRGTPAIVNIGFNPVAQFTPLQAADVIATENYWHALGVISGDPTPRAHMAHFLKRVSTEGYILEEAEIIETLKSQSFWRGLAVGR